ncbi:biopolymer transporter ExbD [Lamprocystis purpurea]|jgi:biopolymer transport protein ExbD|uniref:biopolymer transporter ExbD n=1 Tax=Lamprocystis purpurea TaxID=61598 RepID=UPI00039F9A96|nr:biopolymer transporter ExbD [Lamprocystis purpurea]
MMKKMDQINVIPFIDIMLVLLAIVLTTATFIVEGRLQIRLPTAASQGAPESIEPREIAIDADGQLYFQSLPLGVGAPGLRALAPQLAELEPRTPIVLRVDAATRFAAFIAVVDQLKARGLERLSIVTRRP